MLFPWPTAFVILVQHSAANPSSHDYSYYLGSTEGITALSTVVIAATTIWYAIVSTRSLNAFRRQIRLSEETAERQLRAYVLGETASIFNVANPVPMFPGQTFQPTGAEITNPASGPGVIIQIKNTGQTPAFKVNHWGNICFAGVPLSMGLPAPLPQPFIFESVLGPGISSTKLLFMPQPLSTAEVASLRNGTGAVYVYGHIEYEDAFGNARRSSYRLLHHVTGGAIGVSTSLTFADGGNDAN